MSDCQGTEMQTSSHGSKRHAWRRMFISPDESRLRSGWRLIIHAILTLGLYILFVLVAGIFLLIASQAFPMDADLAPQISYLASVVVITISTFIARRFLDRRTFRSLGFQADKHLLLDLAVGFGIPALMMGAIYAFEWSVGWLTFEGWAWDTLPVSRWLGATLQTLLLFILVGYQEELLSRGYHLQNFAEGLNLGWGVFLSSAVFALLHMGNPSAGWASLVGLLAAGFFLAYAWVRTRRLWLPIGLHIGWNFFEGTIFGFPVSGLGGFHLIRQTTEGPTLITGGPFGPEAGLVVLPALLLGGILIWVYTRGRSESDADTGSASPTPLAPPPA